MVAFERVDPIEPTEFETWFLIQIKLPVEAFNRFQEIIHMRFHGKTNLMFLLSRLK